MKKLKIGQTVQWRCRPYGGRPFIARGIIRDIFMTTFGAKQRKAAVRVLPEGKEYIKAYPGRRTTVVAADKVEIVH